MRPLRVGLLALTCLAPALHGACAPSGHIEVEGLDPAVELHGALERLSLGTKARPISSVPYVKALDAALGPYAGDAAVGLYAGVRREAPGSSPDQRGPGFLNALLYLDTPPALAQRSPIPSALVDQVGGRRRFADWLSGLRAFAARSRFMDVFAANQASLEPSVAAFRKAVGERDYLGKIERYSGLPLEGRYRIALSPLFPEGAVVNSVAPQEDGSYEIATLFGGAARSGGGVDFESQDLPTTAWHEIGHGILDVLADLYRPEIARKSSAYASIPGGCYGEWQQCVKEHVVRAVMIRLIARDLGPQRAESVLHNEGSARYPYLRAMTESLKEYEAHRDRYPTLADYYGELLKTIPEPGPGAKAQAESLPLPDEDSGLRWVVSTAVAFPATGQRSRALRVLDGMLRTSSDPELRLRRAELLYHLERYPEAQAQLDSIVNEQPRRPEALLLRALTRRALGDAAGAHQDLSAAAGLCAPTSSEAFCRDPRTWLARVDKTETAGVVASSSAQGRKSATSVVPGLDADALRRRAEEAFGRGDDGAALRELDRAAAADAKDPQIWMDRGVVLHALRRRDDSLKSYDRAIELARSQDLPGDRELVADTLSSRASQLKEDGRLDEARADLAAALQAGPAGWLRRIETEQELRTWGDPQPLAPATVRPDPDAAVSNTLLSSDGKFLLTTTEAGTADLWDLRQGARVRRFDGIIHTMHPAAFTPDGKSLLLWMEDFTGRLWDLASLREVRRFKGYGQTVYAVAFTPDARYFATAAFDQTARLWDAASGRPVRVFKEHPGTLEALAASPDGRLLATLSFGVVRLWDIGSGRLVRTIKSEQGWILSMAFSPDGARLAAGCSDFAIRIWRVSDGERLARLYGHFDGVDGVVFTRDGNRLLSASRDETARLWDLSAGKPVRTFSGHRLGVRTVTLSADDRLLVTGGWDGTTRFWDVGTGRELSRLVSSKDGWAVVTPTGEYEGTPQALRSLEPPPPDGASAQGLLPRTLGLGAAPVAVQR